MDNYKGSIELISGLTPKNNGNFPLLNTEQIQAKSDGTRLYQVLENLDSDIKNGVGKSQINGSKTGEIFNDYTNNVASGDKSHSEGFKTSSSGDYSHAEGLDTIASGKASHSSGQGTDASGNCQTVIGKFNIKDGKNEYGLIIGNGTDDTHRSNAFAVDWDGNIITPNGTMSVISTEDIDEVCVYEYKK